MGSGWWFRIGGKALVLKRQKMKDIFLKIFKVRLINFIEQKVVIYCMFIIVSNGVRGPLRGSPGRFACVWFQGFVRSLL